MKYATIFYFATAVSVIAGGALSPALAAQKQPVVVELFTSQGCSSCPPANANLVKLSKDPSVLALSFAVTYWDYLGWKDIFGKAEFTERQATYEPPLGQSGSFTPQMVVNGRQSTVGNDMKQIRDIIASEPPLDGPRISLTKTAASLEGGSKPKAAADIWLVRYDPGLVNVAVARGENSGETLPHAHVVHELKRLGSWSGAVANFTLPPPQKGWKTAILVQEPNGGNILSAATE